MMPFESATPYGPSSASSALHGTFDRANSDVVLIVDYVPDNLSVLHDALD